MAARDSMFGMPSDKSEKPRAQTPSDTVSLASTADKSQDIKKIIHTMNRMDKPQLQEQRFDIDPAKGDELAELEIMAKLERALSRRLNDQAAVFTRRTGSVARTSTGSGALSKEVLV